MSRFVICGLIVSLLVMGIFSFGLAQDAKKPAQKKERDLDAVIAGNNQFAFELYARMAKKDGNIVFSPYSISMALAMTYGGARGETAEQMAKVLHFNLGQERLHLSFGKVATELQNEGQDRPYHLSIANAIWGRKGEPIVKEYRLLTEKHYGAGVQEIDFSAKPHKVINRWVEEKTRKKIKDLLGEADVNAGTRLVLTNAIYFKATWLSPFPKEQTKEASFEKTVSDKFPVAMMRSHEGLFKYHSGGDFQFVELPYKGDRLAMVLMLPRERGRLAEAELKLSATSLREGLSKLKSHKGTVELPRFTVTQRIYLADELKSMGMVAPFSPDADFSGISSKVAPLGSVIHQAYVDVDEMGTEAAAATAVVFPRIDFPSFSFRADQPFLFLIHDRETGSVLFVGRVTNPPVFQK